MNDYFSIVEQDPSGEIQTFDVMRDDATLVGDAPLDLLDESEHLALICS